MEKIRAAKLELERLLQEGAKRRVINEAIDKYQQAIKESAYNWEKVNGKEEIARIEGSTIIILNTQTWEEEIIQK